MNSKITKDSIIQDLMSIGIKQGDLLFITADLLKVGLVNKKRSLLESQWIDILKTCVGPNGTIIVSSNTPTFFKFKKNSNIIFERFAKSTSGSLSNIFINQRDFIRSKHPSNSYVGFGPLAAEILSNHDEKSLSYDPIGEIIKLGGKNLMLGTVDNKNAPMVMHYCQQVLKLTTLNPLLGMFQSYYFDENNKLKIFTVNDAGGCSSGGKNLFGQLIINNSCVIGKIGNALSCLIDSKESYRIILKSLTDNPSLILCDNLNCLSCYGNFSKFPIRALKIYFHYFKLFIKKPQ
jgi:aminoglycoside N3'-acetyltransferase